MTDEASSEEKFPRSVAPQNARTLPAELQRAEDELRCAKDALQAKSDELAHSVAMLWATFESTTDAILVTDIDGRVTGFNNRFKALWGVSQAGIEKANHRQLIESLCGLLKDPEAFRVEVESIYANSPAETFDVLEFRDGRVIERFSKTQLLNGQHVGRVWSFRDITERRRAQLAPFRLAALVESSDDAIVSKSLDGVITSWNKAAERMFGYTAEEAIGRSITILIPPDRLDEETMILSKLRRGERIRGYEAVRMRKDGRMLDVSLTVSPIRDAEGKIIGASKIARDITERKLAARQREELLEAERAARAAAERMSLMKDEFLANISHELRTPLNAILGWAHILATRKSDGEDLKQGLETISRNAKLQAQLIEDLLDMSRIVSGKVRLDVQQTDLARVVQQAVDTVRPSAEVKGIRLRQIIDPMIGPVSGDPNRLQQVVWNLLTNAVKFTSRGGTVDVLLQRVNSHLEITVHDSGVGIKPEFLPRVFERFQQADSSTTRTHGGLGLGLAIVKQLVELHGGTVTAKSAGEGLGATFIVSLPLAPVRDEQQREHPSTTVRSTPDSEGLDLSGIKVLVVEDEPDARGLIERVLGLRKAEVRTAAGARDAMELLGSYRPDVLVSDIGMPETDGYQFIRQVRRLTSGQGGHTPAVALTAFARSEDRTRAMLAGYQMHLSKPIEPQELVAAVGTLAGRGLNRER